MPIEKSKGGRRVGRGRALASGREEQEGLPLFIHSFPFFSFRRDAKMNGDHLGEPAATGGVPAVPVGAAAVPNGASAPAPSSAPPTGTAPAAAAAGAAPVNVAPQGLTGPAADIINKMANGGFAAGPAKKVRLTNYVSTRARQQRHEEGPRSLTPHPYIAGNRKRPPPR